LGLTIEHTSSTEDKKESVRKPAKTIFNIRIPSWFLQQQYNLQFQRATAGWPFHLSVHRIIPRDSPIADACMYGDINMVRRLLSTKEYSVYDRNVDGESLFFTAAYSKQLEICSFLRQQGIFAQIQHEDYKSLLVAAAVGTDSLTQDYRSWLRVIEPPHNNDEEWFEEHLDYIAEGDAMKVRMLFRPRAREGAARFLEFRDFISASASDIVGNWCDRPEFVDYVADCLCDADISRELQSHKEENGWIAFLIARMVHLEELEHSLPLQRAMRACIHAGFDIHQCLQSLPIEWDYIFTISSVIEECESTPLGNLYQHSMKRREYVCFHRWMKKWVTSLFLAGVDLTDYGTKELPKLQVMFDKQREATGLRSELFVGARPDDWRFTCWLPYEHLVRQFWCMVEGKPVVPVLALSILQKKLCILQDRYEEVHVPGSWSEPRDGFAEQLVRLEHVLSNEFSYKDYDLARMEQSLASMTAEQFFEKHLHDDAEFRIAGLHNLWLPRFRICPVFVQ
jgi:hypothetical protein